MKVTNYLLGYKDLRIIQDSDMFNFSLDSVLLPNFVTINKKIDKIGSYVKDNLQILEDIDTSNYDQETLKKFNEVKELLEYSDPVSNDKTLDIEKNIQSLIKNNEGNKTYWEKIEKLMKKRNEICKNNKK